MSVSNAKTKEEQELSDLVDLAGPHGTSRVFLVRHPQTTANVAGQYLGWGEAPLSEIGEKQRCELVEAYSGSKVTQIIASPLSRCADMAHLLAKELDAGLVIDKRIKELGFGDMEGLTAAEAAAKNITPFWEAKNPLAPAPNGELFTDFYARIHSIGNELKRVTEDTIVVAHGGVIRGLIAYWLSMPAESFFQLRVQNVSSTVFSFIDEVPIMEYFGLSPAQLKILPAD